MLVHQSLLVGRGQMDSQHFVENLTCERSPTVASNQRNCFPLFTFLNNTHTVFRYCNYRRTLETFLDSRYGLPLLDACFLHAGQARNSQTPCDRRETLGRRNKQVCDRRRSDLNYRIMEVVRLMEKIPSKDQE